MCPDCSNKISLKLVLLLFISLCLGLYAFGADSKIVVKDQQSLLKVLESNESVHKDLFKYDFDKLNMSVNTLIKSIEAIENPAIKKLLKFSKENLKKALVSEDRETINQSYNLFSMALIHTTKEYKLKTDYAEFYCPMEKKKWIQNTSKVSEVQNPYAANMPNCGTKEASLK